MFTQVGFGDFLRWYLDKARRERAIEFSEYPRAPVRWLAGQWLYEVQQGFRVRLFRWLEREKGEVVIEGPYADPNETPQTFKERFGREFEAALDQLS